MGGWTHANELKLLITIIESTTVKPAWGTVAEALGEGFTAEAVRQHYAKLRKTGGSQATPVAVNNPKKPKAGGRSRKRQRSIDSNVSISPTKKPFRPRKLFQNSPQVGTATASLSSLNVASPRKGDAKTLLPEKAELGEKAKKDAESGEEAGESGDDACNYDESD